MFALFIGFLYLGAVNYRTMKQYSHSKEMTLNMLCLTKLFQSGYWKIISNLLLWKEIKELYSKLYDNLIGIDNKVIYSIVNIPNIKYEMNFLNEETIMTTQKRLCIQYILHISEFINKVIFFFYSFAVSFNDFQEKKLKIITSFTLIGLEVEEENRTNKIKMLVNKPIMVPSIVNILCLKTL